MRFLHLFPFDPTGLHGGTMRLRNALHATEQRAETLLYAWDVAAGTWTDATRPEPAGTPRSHATPPGPPSALGRLKRRTFPSTLWESGRTAVREARTLLPEVCRAGDTVVLHTTYLAPLVPELRRRGLRVVVDVYDLVWRAHRMDAAHAAGPRAAILDAYARTTRRREMHLLEQADALAVVGWMDLRYLQTLPGVDARWAPVGVPAPDVPERTRSGPLAVGLVGNFAHSATSDAANRLVRSDLARDAGVRLVFAGPGSEAWGTGDRVVGMGEVAHVDAFYREIDASVVPVANGSGMKCKLAESVMALRATVTTPMGGEGYPPHLASLLTIVADEQAMDASVVRRAIAGTDLRQARSAFAAALGPDAAAARYLDAVAP